MSSPHDYNQASAAAQRLAACKACGRVQPVANEKCSRCGASLHLRKPYSLQRTIAYTIAAAIFYIPANTFPMMNVRELGSETASTILEGVAEFWELEAYVIASVIFIASVVIPLLKLVAIIRLCMAARSNHDPVRLTKLYRVTELIGRWSMIDIFVVAILITLVQLDSLMSIEPGPAALAFAAVVILTMFAAMSYDPRLIWDAADRTQRKATT